MLANRQLGGRGQRLTRGLVAHTLGLTPTQTPAASRGRETMRKADA